MKTLSALAVALLLAPVAIAADRYEIDPAHSQVIFKVKHLGVSYNYGRFNEISGSYTLDAEDPAGSSFEVTVRADSVDTADGKRDQHLRSPDFFNATQFPVITLKSKSVTQEGEKTYDVVAELSLRGKKKEIPLEIVHVGSAEAMGAFRSGFVTEFSVSRSEFGMNYMPQGLGDEVTLLVNIEGKRE